LGLLDLGPALINGNAPRLRTLLIVTALADLFFLGPRSPTSIMAGIVSTFTLATVLFAVLMATYCTGASRAFAVGYLVFCVGYLVHPAIANWTGQSLPGETSPAWAAFFHLYILVHGPTPGHATNFATICHNALSCTLGLAGAVSAELLYRRHQNGRDVPPS
jgi:hypothetical protein